MDFEAIVLAGGLGTRLRPAVPDRPKVLAPVAGRPFVSHLLSALAGAGCRKAVLAVGHRHKQVTEALGSAAEGMPLVYSVEDRPLGTGGAVARAARLIDQRRFFVLNGDSFADLDFGAMAAAHRTADANLSIAVRQVPEVGRFGAVRIEGGRVIGFEEKARGGPGAINAGVYLIESAVLTMATLPESFSLERDFLPPRLSQLRPLAFPTGGLFIDIGVPEDYALAQRLFGSSRFAVPSGATGARTKGL